MYMIMSSYFVQFEEKMTFVRNIIFEYLHLAVLKTANFFNEVCMTRITPERLVEMQAITEQMDQDLRDQIRLFGVDVASEDRGSSSRK